MLAASVSVVIINTRKEKPDHIHNKVQQKKERGWRTEKKKKKKKEKEEAKEEEEDGHIIFFASWCHPCFFVVLFLFSFSMFFIFYFFLYGSDSMGSKEPWEAISLRFLEPWGPTVIHTSSCFFHRTVLEAQRIAKINSSRFFWSDRTVRSGFQNLGLNRPCF